MKAGGRASPGSGDGSSGLRRSKDRGVYWRLSRSWRFSSLDACRVERASRGDGLLLGIFRGHGSFYEVTNSVDLRVDGSFECRACFRRELFRV